jgi:tripartite ATP-independent transporter DctM subunit
MAARQLPGSLAIAALLTCAVFSTASGIVGAVVTLMGLLAYPAMANANYDKSFAAGVICAGGTLGILIPPSIMLIVYAAVAELSPLRLYAAAMLPGLMLAGLYVVYVMVRAAITPSLAPKPRLEDVPPASKIYFDLMVSFVPLTVLIMLVLGSILGGLATPAEAAAMGAMGGLVLAFLYRSLTWTKVKESVFLTAKATAMVCWLFVGSWTFASVFSVLGGHDLIAHWVVSMNLEAWQFLVVAQLIIFILGWPLEWSEILIIFVPIFLPMLDTFGVNPYFFAMLVALNLQTSFLTPPMAMSAYYLKGVLKKQIELVEIFKGIIPYLGIVILCMILMYRFPGIALWFPDYLFGEYIP